jgi:hypothetical protein
MDILKIEFGRTGCGSSQYDGFAIKINGLKVRYGQLVDMGFGQRFDFECIGTRVADAR